MSQYTHAHNLLVFWNIYNKYFQNAFSVIEFIAFHTNISYKY